MLARRRCRAAVTLAEVFALAVALALLCSLLATAVMAAEKKKQGNRCQNNLRQLHRLTFQYTVTYGGYLPAFWHERWVGEMGLVGKAWGRLPHDLDPRVPTVWNNPSPNPIGGFPVRSGCPILVCPDDEGTWRCDQGCHVSYLGLAKYGWWHRDAEGGPPRFEYHQVAEYDEAARRILLAETEPATWQHGSCGCRWIVARHPVQILDRHDGGGQILFLDGHVFLAKDPVTRRISHWEPGYDKLSP